MNHQFEFDHEKSRRNGEKHGIDFIEAQELWNVSHVLFRARNVDGEDRQIIIGELAGQVYLAIFVVRNGATRLISCHRADSRWENVYKRALHEKKES